MKRSGIALLLVLLCAGCARQATPVPSAPTLPSPTIVAIVVQPAQASPSPAQPGAAPAGPTAAAARPSPAPAPSIFLWPSYLPPALHPSPQESRVSSASETGAAGLGFYLVTLNAGSQKLTIGGGDIADVLPLSGAERPISAGTRSGKLISSGEQREIVFDVPRGKLFIYSAGLSEEELLKVAGSLQPIDVEVLRRLAAGKG